MLQSVLKLCLLDHDPLDKDDAIGEVCTTKVHAASVDCPPT